MDLDPKRLPGAEEESVPAWAGPALLAAVFITLTLWSWRKWPDLRTDFGLQLYVPWQLAAGKVLYRDIAYNFGPLSSYLNALAFRVFGTSLTTLIFLNLSILAAMTGLLYRLLAEECDRLAAASACLVLLCVFSFSQYVGSGNYNFVCPYSHEATHGTALSAAMIALLARGLALKRLRLFALAGFCWGLVFLTKPEVTLAAAVAAGLGLGYARSSKAVLLFLGAALVPIASFFLYFWMEMAAPEALRAVCGAWMPLVGGHFIRSNYYLVCLGFDRITDNLWAIVRMSGEFALACLCAVGADYASRQLKRRTWLGAAAGGAVFGFVILRRDLFPWWNFAQPLPLLTLLALAASFLSGRRVLTLWAAFALALLAKMPLNTILYHYGFFLAMPAALLLVVCLVDFIPKALAARTGGGTVFRCLALGWVAAVVFVHLRRSDALYAMKELPVGRGADAIIGYSPDTDPADAVMGEALDRIEALVPKEATLATIPDGVMLNYLSRRVNPTRQLIFSPFDISFRGEETVIADFQARPPDFIALVHANAQNEFNVGYFGEDPRFGRRLMEWVNGNYEPMEVIFQEPFKERRFGIKFLRSRRPAMGTSGGRSGAETR